MCEQYLIAYMFLGAPISAYLSLETIAWLVAYHKLGKGDGLRVWHISEDLCPEELYVRINRSVYAVGLFNRDGVCVDCAQYPVPPIRENAG